MSSSIRIQRATVEVDNRDAGQMYEYLEARIDFLKRRVAELEAENRTLRAGSGQPQSAPRFEGTLVREAGAVHLSHTN